MKEARIRTAFFLILLGGVCTLVFFIFRPYLITLSLAATAAVILYPIYRKILSAVGGKKSIAAIGMVVLSFVFLLLPLSLIGIQISTDAADLYQYLQNDTVSTPIELLQRLEMTFERYIPYVSINLDQHIGQVFSLIAENLQSLFTGTVKAIFLVLLGTVAYYYMLKDGKRFLEELIELSPLTIDEDSKIIERLHKAVNSVIRGSLIIALLQGCVTGIGLMIFGIPSPVLFGAIAGICALIPTVGTSIVLIPAIIYLIIMGDYLQAFGLVAWGTLAVGVIDNLLYPILVGKGMHMHPLLIFFAVIGGIAYFGVAGIILGPLTMSLLFGLLDIYRQEVT